MRVSELELNNDCTITSPKCQRAYDRDKNARRNLYKRRLNAESAGGGVANRPLAA